MDRKAQECDLADMYRQGAPEPRAHYCRRPQPGRYRNRNYIGMAEGRGGARGLNQDCEPIRSVGHVVGQTHEDEQGQGEERPAPGDHVERPRDEAHRKEQQGGDGRISDRRHLR